MSTLAKTKVLEQISRMEFTPREGEKVRELVACMDESGRVSMEALGAEIFPGKSPKTIMDNTANRLRWINKAAAEAGIPIQAVLASNDSGWSGVQVEWTFPPPPEALLWDTALLSEPSHLILQAVPKDMETRLFESHVNSQSRNGDRMRSPEAEANLDILDELDAWVADPSGKPLFVIFGDFGKGKTITCQSFAQKQRAICQTNPDAPWPLYFDLRMVQVNNGIAPTLMDTMLQCAHRGWKRADNVTSDDLWSWINRGAVVIFDGLDEVLTKLNRNAGRMYTDDLLSVIDQADVPIRVLMSSRSQFFRNLREERSILAGRSYGDSSWFEARWLLPLSEEQRRRYIEASLPTMDVDHVMTMISETHDLSDLSRRALLLNLITRAIPSIADRRDNGLPVNGSTIYRELVHRWLDRDDLKHHIKPRHKINLVEGLAAELWRSREPIIPVEHLEEWFSVWRKHRPGWNIYEEVSRDKLEEDLRNSTFLSRVDLTATQGAFRFAHTSLAEFFLSEYMLHALEEDVPERWAMKPPSWETYGFFGMSLAEKDEATRQELLTTLGSWFTGVDVSINTAILGYRLNAGYAHLPQLTLPLIRPEIESVSVDDAKRLLQTMQPGDHVCVGGYSWTLLDKGFQTALLLCDQIVDYQPYNPELVDVTWQTCTLRAWLNRDFLSTLPQDFQDAMAPVDASKKKITLTTGKKGVDKLFLLSTEEAERNLLTEETRVANRHDGDTWRWWLRSVDGPRADAPVVGPSGRVFLDGYGVHGADGGVRPALMMRL